MKKLKFTTVGIDSVLPYHTAYGSAIDMVVELRETDVINLLENFSLEEIIKFKEIDCNEVKEIFLSLEKDCEDER